MPDFNNIKDVSFIQRCFVFVFCFFRQKGTSWQRSGKGEIRKRFPLQKQRREKNYLTIRKKAQSEKDSHSKKGVGKKTI